jgi:hypothetical protein
VNTWIIGNAETCAKELLLIRVSDDSYNTMGKSPATAAKGSHQAMHRSHR